MLTILIAVYETEQYLPSVLQSLCDQTCRPDHVILCDDGGGYDLQSVIEPFQDQLSCQIIRHETNRGTYSARRSLIAACGTDYAAFVDPDDQLHPQAVEFWMETARETGADIIMSCLRRRQHVAGLSAAYEFEELERRMLTRDEALWACFDTKDQKATALQLFSGGGKMFRTQCLAEGAALAGDMGHLVFAEDSLLVLSALTRCRQISHINAELYDHIERPESSSMRTGVEVATKFIEDTDRVVTCMGDVLEAADVGYPGLLSECNRMRAHFERIALRQRLGVNGPNDPKLGQIIETAPSPLAQAAKAYLGNNGRFSTTSDAPMKVLRLEIKDLVSAPVKVDCGPDSAPLYRPSRTVSSAG